jgi:thiaminase/transcriptional activator TenA
MALTTFFYWMLAYSSVVAFFTAHEEIGEQVTPIDALVLAHYDTAEDRQRITRAVRLSHEFELLFYDTVMAAPRSEP